ncbi:glycosyltransferase family 2 protein [Anabaena subtropica]|uniref:Glycosyltransferase n=1 Tax=Anabaena subtropica FACHB-260 TaxID=2692884 RepID=A0ABR8CJU3_9NOST|nr:glycosyltransferase [Anabaena subtropica]MBD2343420.1 glycosyltransferase [Anabaena subtropica FACHB-260]
MPPKVSICLPNLNNRRFLPERLDSILSQTFQDWELVIVDSYSDDGAWELLQEYAAKEPRIRLFQAPREGIYAGFNACIRLAHGEYIYIATSDDTMRSDCLEKMVKALDSNRDCNLCQCGLVFIDEKSQPLPPDKQWNQFGACNYFKLWLEKYHKRLAPHDGILHFAVNTVYTSVTQLLIRKRVFDEIGYFETCWGPMGDFEWGMRASLLYNTVYLPEYLATWRKHSAQATTNPYTPKNLNNLLRMAHHALKIAKKLNPKKVKGISFSELAFEYEMAMVTVGINERKQVIAKLIYLFHCLFKIPKTVTYYILNKIFYSNKNKDSSINWITSKIINLGVSGPIEINITQLNENLK